MHRTIKHTLRVFAIIALGLLTSLVAPPKAAAQTIDDCNAGVDIVPGTYAANFSPYPGYPGVGAHVELTNTTSVTCVVLVTFYLDVTYMPTGVTHRVEETTMAALPPLGDVYNPDGKVYVGVSAQFVDITFNQTGLITTSVPANAVVLRKFNPR
jgi:hypothetical protein